MINVRSNIVLVVVAHPDDEVLGCGGVIAKHVTNQDLVYLLVLSNGVSSRNLEKSALNEQIQLRREALKKACHILGVKEYIQQDFPDNAFDSIKLIDLVQAIEKVVDDIKPTIIYTHFLGDLNIDHQLTHQAVMTACRPLPGASVKAIYSFEVLSATHYNAVGALPQFAPNCYVDISAFFEKKMEALAAYNIEMREFPHARSVEGVKALLKFRGSTVGVDAAEAFVVERLIQ